MEKTFFGLPFKRLGGFAPFPWPQFRKTAVEVIIIGYAGLPATFYPRRQLVLEEVEFVSPLVEWYQTA